MIIYSVVAFAVIFFGAKFSKTYHKDYISPYSTTCVKGLFVLVVFFSHFDSYVTYSNSFDLFYCKLNIGQAMVTMFLFYSGYGVMESIKKSENYVKNMPVKRILPLLLSFFTAVAVYIAVSAGKGQSFTIKDVMLSLIGWQSAGNSNWYIFDIIILYGVTFFAFSLLSKVKRYSVPVTVVVLISVAFIVLLKLSGKASFWYDTVLCYSFGMYYSLYRFKIEKYIFHGKIRYYAFLVLSIILTVIFLLVYLKTGFVICEFISLLLFTAFSLFATMKLKIGNKCLYFLGNHLFEIYISMRLPMILLKPYLSLGNMIYFYFPLVFIITLLIAVIFKKYNIAIKNAIISIKGSN